MTYRTVSIEFWTDPKVEDDFEMLDKYVYLYLLTNSNTNICGCFNLSFERMKLETRLTKEQCVDELHRLQNLDVIRYNEKTREVLILNWGRYNWSKSIKLVRAVEKAAEKIKSEELKQTVLERLREFNIGKIIETDTETDNSNSNSMYAYPTDTVSIGYQKKQKKNRNYSERQYDFDAMESAMVRKG